MRASRLLTIMMLLQSRGRLSAEVLAAELEVSVRTVYRDVDQLSASGVPIYAETGRHGGFQLLEGWRTRLTGLTTGEAQALFLSGLPGPADQLGLGDEVASAELKLLATLPEDWRLEAQRVSSRFHLDPAGWFQPGAAGSFLRQVARAVWGQKRIVIRYEGWKQVSEPVLEPLGLVLKGGIWYVVALRERKPRTYRLSSILSLIEMDETFERPTGFDLPEFWAASTEQFEKDIYVGDALVRVTDLGLRRLKEVSHTLKTAIEAAPPSFDASGWAKFTIPVEETGWTVREITRIGAEIEVLAPPALRDAMIDVAQRLGELYRLTSRPPAP